MYHVEFKGLDFAFEISPIAFELFGKPVYWYGIIITLGIVLSVAYAFYRLKKENVKADDMYDYAIFTVIFGIIGARLYYVFANLSDYKTFYSVIAIWNGGLAIYGGIIGGALAILLVSLFKKKNALTVLDCVAPAVMIGQFIGRWGNYANQEAFGSNTDLLWGMRSWRVPGSTPSNIQGTREYLENHASELMAKNPDLQIDPNGYVHPTFLYESLWNLVGFIIIHLLYKKKKFNGQILLMYLAWYGFGRMIIEGLRTDSLYISDTNIRVSQLLGFLCFTVCSVLLIVFYIIALKKPTALAPIFICKQATDLSEITESEDEISENEASDDDISEDDINDLMALDGCDASDVTPDGEIEDMAENGSEIDLNENLNTTDSTEE